MGRLVKSLVKAAGQQFIEQQIKKKASSVMSNSNSSSSSHPPSSYTSSPSYASTHLEPSHHSVPPDPRPITVQVYSHNIRQDATNPMENERPWSVRKDGIVAAINYAVSLNLPTLVGLQEVKQNQLNDILIGLGPQWSFYGVGRDDGQAKGEFAPILFKNTDWDLLSGQTKWLGTTPDRPSKGWDAAFERIVTIVVVKHRYLGKIVTFLNTHFDHKGQLAKENSAKQIVDIMSKSAGATVLSGDFNSEKHEIAYRTLAQTLNDTSCNCQEKKGYEFTDTGFDPKQKEKCIDFIWVPRNTVVLKHEVLPSEYNGFLMSDHRPVTAYVQV